MNIIKKVLWVFSVPNPQIIPSNIVSGIMPANHLGIKKIIFLPTHNPVKTLQHYNPKIIIFSKALHSNIVNLAIEAKKRKIVVISVFDDWHFNSDSLKKTKQFNINKLLSDSSDIIVVKTKSAAEIIKKNIGIRAKIIPDCIRYESFNPISKINYPLNIVWFGSNGNHDTLIFGLNEILSSNIDCKIKIITNKTTELQENLIKNKFQSLNYKIISFSNQSLTKEVYLSEIVIIPFINDYIRFVKSPNRIVDALNFGRFVVMSKTKQYINFEKYCYQGNIGSGLKWVIDNQQEAIKKTKEGNSFVKKNFHISSVSKIWKELLKTFDV